MKLATLVRNNRALIPLWATILLTIVCFSFMYFIVVPIVTLTQDWAQTGYSNYNSSYLQFFSFSTNFFAYLGFAILVVCLIWAYSNSRKSPYE